MRDFYDRSLARTSFTLVMLAIAGAAALVLGVVGLYGVISYAVSQRRREIAIRLALGAPQARVVRTFVRYGAGLAAVGVVIGLGAAAALTRLMGTLVYDVRTIDPPTYALVAVVLTGAAALASWLPARRAAAVDPGGSPERGVGGLVETCWSATFVTRYVRSRARRRSRSRSC